MPRLFIAAWPDEPTKRVLRRVPRPDEEGVRWVPEANWHITLRFVGDADVDELAAVLAGAALPSADVALGPRVVRLGTRLLVIPATGVDDLAAAVREATADLGQPERRRFHGHLTLARKRRDANSTVYGTPFEGGWQIDRVALVSSDTDDTGSVYTTVASFPTG